MVSVAGRVPVARVESCVCERMRGGERERERECVWERERVCPLPAFAPVCA